MSRTGQEKAAAGIIIGGVIVASFMTTFAGWWLYVGFALGVVCGIMAADLGLEGKRR